MRKLQIRSKAAIKEEACKSHFPFKNKTESTLTNRPELIDVLRPAKQWRG